MSARYVNTLLTATIMILVSMNGVLDFSETENESPELLELVQPQFATSPGHVVFAEYVGADWCAPCQNGGSPSMTALNNNFPDEFTFLSYFESGGSYPPDPLNHGNSDGLFRRCIFRDLSRRGCCIRNHSVRQPVLLWWKHAECERLFCCSDSDSQWRQHGH